MDIEKYIPFLRNRGEPGVNLQSWLLLLLLIGLLSGCKTVPIQDRNFAENGGF